ncbi:hypothetical protein D3C80_1744430 [compost metagenome]
MVNRHRIDDVDLAGLIAVDVGGLRGNRQIGYLVDHRVRIIPIARVTFSNNALVDHPLRKLIRPTADEMLRFRPLFTKTADQHFINRDE